MDAERVLFDFEAGDGGWSNHELTGKSAKQPAATTAVEKGRFRARLRPEPTVWEPKPTGRTFVGL